VIRRYLIPPPAGAEDEEEAAGGGGCGEGGVKGGGAGGDHLLPMELVEGAGRPPGDGGRADGPCWPFFSKKQLNKLFEILQFRD